MESKQINSKEINNVVKLSNKVKATCIENIFDPHNSQKIIEFEYGSSIGEIVSRFNPILSSELEVVVSIDGIALEETEQYKIRSIIPKSSSSVVFSVVPKGGDGGKNPLAMVAMLAVMVVAWYAGPAIASAMTGIQAGTAAAAASTTFGVISAVGTLAVNAIGGVLINSVFGGPTLPDIGAPGSDSLSDSPTHGWETTPNPTEQGVAVPVLYGRFRIVPPIINQFVTVEDDNQTYNALYCIADHKIDVAGNVYINDNPEYNYDNIVLDYRYGEIDQGIIPAFSDTVYDKNVGLKLTDEWKQSETDGNAVEGIGCILTIPGLFYANNKGGLDNETVTINLQYRKKGEETWVDIKSEDDIYEEHIIEEPRWSAGYYLPDGRWFELEVGGVDKSEHVDGERYTSDSGKAFWRYLDITYKISYVRSSISNGDGVHGGDRGSTSTSTGGGFDGTNDATGWA